MAKPYNTGNSLWPSTWRWRSSWWLFPTSFYSIILFI